MNVQRDRVDAMDAAGLSNARSSDPTQGGEVGRQLGPIRVLQKSAAIMNSLAVRTEMTPAEIAEEVDEPRSSVYRLLSSLRELGFVDAGNREGTVRLGIKLLRLGGAVAAGFNERTAALPVMEELARRTGETVFLCVRHGWNAVCIERIEGEMVQSLALKLGGSMPLHLGGAPPVLLAFEDSSVWDEYIETQDLVGYTQNSVTNPDELRKSLNHVKKRGYAVSDEDITLGIAAVGAPIFDYTGRVRAAVSISGTRPLILGDVAQTSGMVVDAARQITRALGGDG
jgi:DNA-binding IclR family transcriptional regulator